MSDKHRPHESGALGTKFALLLIIPGIIMGDFTHGLLVDAAHLW